MKTEKCMNLHAPVLRAQYLVVGVLYVLNYGLAASLLPNTVYHSFFQKNLLDSFF